jgi:hypothetical protein
VARQIVKQPNGKFACWSSIVDDFIVKDLTAEQYAEWSAQQAYEFEKRNCEHAFKDLNGHKHYFKDWKKCIELKAFFLGVEFKDSMDEETLICSDCSEKLNAFEISRNEGNGNDVEFWECDKCYLHSKLNTALDYWRN